MMSQNEVLQLNYSQPRSRHRSLCILTLSGGSLYPENPGRLLESGELVVVLVTAAPRTALYCPAPGKLHLCCKNESGMLQFCPEVEESRREPGRVKAEWAGPQCHWSLTQDTPGTDRCHGRIEH